MEIQELVSKIVSEATKTDMVVKIYDTATNLHYDIDSVEFVPNMKQLDIEINSDK